MAWKGKAAIVTGGERGIGRGITEAFIQAGMAVCMAGMDVQAGRQTVSDLDAGEALWFTETDVGDEGSVQALVEDTLQRIGRIDAVIANAGIADAGGQAVEDLSLDNWDKVIRTNLTGCFLCAKHTFKELRKRKGSMVLIASTRALQSEPDTVAYSASKGGIVALTHSLAISGGPEIRVNAISPGWIYHGDPDDLREVDHSQHPVGRVGYSKDVASMTRYLVSDEAGFVTGQNFVVDGGMTRKMIYAH